MTSSDSATARPTVDELLGEAKSGNADSLGCLLGRYENYLRLLATAQMGAELRARFDMADVVQDTFLEAHRDFSDFLGTTQKEFTSWLRKILANNIGHLFQKHVLAKKRSIHRELSLGQIRNSLEKSGIRLESMVVARDPSPSKDACRREEVVQLADYLASLPDDYRDVLTMRHLQGLPFDEIAEQMGRSSGAVRMLWLRALEKLRQCWEE
ncbi:MAG: sigma-70 family RNA polymerase sigma factor [Planctomycetia bacterium]|jgi:RNA polymerase sigma-70 factor (ECF subfamily)